jgi:HlyD family secretion protein
MTRKRKIAVGALLGVLVVGVAGIAIAAGREKGVSIRSEEVIQRDLVAVVTASGYIQPKRKVDISSDVMGRVVLVAIEEGQWVERGALLLRIDPTTYQAAVNRSEAGVAQARAQTAQSRASLLQAQNAARRAEQLFGGDNLISSADVEQAQTQMAVAEAQYEAAGFQVSQAEAALVESREALRKTTITAPMSGRITRLNIEEGETAIVGTMNNPGSLLLTIADLSEMEARVRVDETQVPRVSLGDSAVVRIDAFRNQDFIGRVTRISNSSIYAAGGAQTGQGNQAQAVDFEVIISLSEPPSELRPDLSATAEIITDQRAGALSIPILALTVRDSAGKRFSADAEMEPTGSGSDPRSRMVEVEGVFLVRDGKARFAPVEIGIVGNRHFEVRSGLVAGDVVAAGPYQAIRDLEDGDPIRTQSTGTGTSGTPAAQHAETDGRSQ